MYRDCILHIGMEKTGTTTIQAALSGHRATLNQAGYHYSRVMGRDNHVNLVVYARDDETSDNQRKRALGRKNMTIGEFRAELETSFAAEAAEHGGETLILSNEHLQSRLTNLNEKRRLRDLLAGRCENLRVYLYLRRQDLVATSIYSTRLLSGGLTSFGNVMPKLKPDQPLPYLYDYLRAWREWCEVFGADRVHLRTFTPETFPEGDVVRDFLDWSGISEDCTLALGPRQNESISVAAQLFMSRMNLKNPPFIDGRPNPLRGRVDQRMMNIGRGRGLRPDRVSAERFYVAFKEDNAVLFREAGLEGEGFEEDFDVFPEAGGEDCVTLEEMADIGVMLYRDVVRELEELRKQLASA